MFRGLYTATSGMQTNQKRLDIISNNMANVNTTAYKKDLLISEAFPELLMRKINGQIPTDTIKADGILEINQEGQAFKLMTERGFFTVEGPHGKNYSRELNFTVDEDGYLRTYERDHNGEIDPSEGNFVLDSAGQRIEVQGQNIDINEEGQVVAGGGTADLIYRPDRGIIGTINSGRRFEKSATNFSPGALEQTDNNIDFAIRGQGFFLVNGPNGDLYTRNGNFTLNQNNELVTSEGYGVMGQNGPIALGENDFHVRNNGDIIVDGQLVDRINLVNITNLKDLNKYGHSYYQVEEDMELNFEEFQGEVLQGFLEVSNINSINEMVDMISVMRAYESNSKVVRTYDEMLQRAVNDIGKI